MSIYAHDEVLAFDGTVQGLKDQLELLLEVMPKHAAFVGGLDRQRDFQ